MKPSAEKNLIKADRNSTNIVYVCVGVLWPIYDFQELVIMTSFKTDHISSDHISHIWAHVNKES